MFEYRNSRGEVVEADRLSATQAKNELGSVLEKVIRGGRVVITKHDVPKAILISVDEFTTLSRDAEMKLDKLGSEFDAALERMQSLKTRVGMKTAFDASPARLGKAAVKAARKRG